VELRREGVGETEEQLLEISVGTLSLCLIEHALACVDTDDSLEATLLKVLPNETSATAHVKNSRFLCLVTGQMLG
jgi:hypothetical protein